MKNDTFHITVASDLASWLYAEAMKRGISVEALIAALIAEARERASNR